MNIEQLYKVYRKHPIICTDTRKISKSCLFFALKGDHFDGNEFALKAIESGAAFAIIDDKKYAVNEHFILVSDVLETLQDLARFHRKQLSIPVIGITGSNGKTTTKELIRSVLSQQFKTFATEGNLNNHIGVPLSVLSIDDSCEIAIIEMGANHQKEIGFLCEISQPTQGLITNVGKAHLEGFGGIEGVRIGKGELYEFIAKTGGTIFINADDQVLKEMCVERRLENIVSYGSGKDNFTSARLIASSPFLEIIWESNGEPSDKNSFTAKSNLPGIYNFDNIVSAICVGSYFNLSPEQINTGISSYHPLNNRSQLLKTEQNTIICDYYNANPSSMIVALNNLESMNTDSKAIILGDMFELGNEAIREHQLILDKALTVNTVRKIFIGEEFYKLKGSNTAEFFRTVQETQQALEKNPIKNCTVLVKGSRGMKLEILLPVL
ncbi:MAG: UDP-N-acetylmuramoyl-tripeptide--D-alanyl-D-alanine ligase [Daejeonella sp.]|uniref:UDP-N-acetylmuramoyl-tripeptide--D-alanyl-D- alanine ligase n=1 Tax=Daejeonella sp. TaxID=2805397 RepID=UPI002732E66A|nr:UDP-N-acetylmuramoyl-tripeptide--D-alanyl-D-alanine ligase [Daejeonella sp.]MDP3466971.1 UDP-N-acetylmuramoyl-tripeptide--D-alanyl-D-alanine ligase [Daejeonella sp.]